MKPRRIRGKWQALYSYRGQVRSAGVYEKYAEAVSAASKARLQAERGTVEAKRRQADPTVEEWLADFLERGRRNGLAPKSVARYQQYIGYLSPLIGGIKLATLSRADVELARDAMLGKDAPQKRAESAPRGLAASRSDRASARTARRVSGVTGDGGSDSVTRSGLALNTVKGAISLLGAACKAAMAVEPWPLLYRNPVEGVKVRSSEPPAEPTMLTLDQTRLLMDTLRGESRKWAANFLMVLLLTMRRSWSELAELRWQDVDLEAGTYRTWERKVKKLRTRPLPPLAVEVLREQRRWQREFYGLPVDFDRSIRVFTRPFHADIDMPLAQASVKLVFDQCLQRAGLPRMKVHHLRHLGASLHLANGVSVPDVQKLGGWEKPDVLLNIYAHSQQEGMRQAGRLLSEQLG